jgi:magnesium chelatase accessory protein
VPHQLVWERDGQDWPNRQASRFVRAAGLRWHVQQMGDGPTLLLVHGTGASTHSWRGVAPLLAARFTIVAPDLPGHGFTRRASSYQLSLPGMALALDALLRELGASPVIVVGHSAGAAILVRMSLDRRIAPRRLVSLNGALLPLHGMAGYLFSPLAKLLASVPLVPWLFARLCADRTVVEQMLRDTGSTIEPFGIDLYARLAQTPSHVAAALGMMANWNLVSLKRELPRLTTPLTLVTAGRDRTISPMTASRVRAIAPSAAVVSLPGLGHLAHEERPDEIAALIGRLDRSTRRRRA